MVAVHVRHVGTYLAFRRNKTRPLLRGCQLFVSIFNHRKLSLTTMKRRADVELARLAAAGLATCTHTYDILKSLKYR